MDSGRERKEKERKHSLWTQSMGPKKEESKLHVLKDNMFSKN